MKRFTYDFAGFVLGAFLCAAPVCLVVVSIFSLGAHRAAVTHGSEAAGTGHSAVGAPNALSLPGTPGLHTGESAASAHSSGFAHSSSVSIRGGDPSRPAQLRSTMVREPGPSEQGAGPVPGRFGRDARGNFSKAFEDGAVWKDTRRRPEAAYLGESRHHGPKFGDGMERVDRRGVSLRPDSRVSREQERPAGIKPGRHLQALATAAANLCGVPVAIFHALIHRESSWRPWVVSSSGAVGLGQIKPSTLRDIDPSLNAWEPWDNLLGSACYLRRQYDRFGTWRKALHAYHGGPNRRVTVQSTHDYATDIIEASN